jgi:dTDP-4-dehydrorhamnose reductase
MARILLTGASGLLGVNFLMQLKAGHAITAVVNNHPLDLEGVDILTVDLLEPGKLDVVFEHARPDWVVHAAAAANLDECEGNPELAHLLNGELPREVALRARQHGAQLLHVSTDAVFNGERGGYKEEDNPSPRNVYARTKLAGEGAVLDIYPEAIVARVNFYGWSRDGARSLAEFFYNNLSTGNVVDGFEDAFFCPLLATDLAILLAQMLEHELNGLYHVLSRESISKHAFGVRIAELFGYDPVLIKPTSIRTADFGAPRSPDLRMNTDKLSQALGIQLPGISDGLVRWFEQYQKGYPAQLGRL